MRPPRPPSLSRSTLSGLSQGMIRNQLGNSISRIRLRAGTRRTYGSQQTTSASSKHSEWYRDIIPGMIPIALLGSSVYLVRRPNPAALLTKLTVGFAHRAYSLRARNCHTRDRWLKPRSVSSNSRRVLKNSNRKSGTCLSKGLSWKKNLPRNPGGGEGLAFRGNA